MATKHHRLVPTLLAMNIGDSFVTDIPRPTVYDAAMRNGLSIVTRVDGGKVRCWRTAEDGYMGEVSDPLPIDTDVPIPPRRGGSGEFTRLRFALRSMRAGESVVVNLTPSKAQDAASRDRIEVTTGIEIVNGERRTRVWRIA